MNGKVIVAAATLALVLCMDWISPVSSISEDRWADSAILAYFDELNTTDIWLARMAVHQGVSDDVRRVGKMIVQDHEHIQAKARALALKLGIVPYPVPEDRSAEKLAELVALLQSKTVSDFDQAYMLQEIEFSEAFLAILKGRMASDAHHTAVKKLLADLTPEFEHHLAHMKEVAQRLNTNGEPTTHAAPHHHAHTDRPTP